MAHVRQTRSSDYERLGARRLGLADVVAQSVGFLGPVFSAAFLVPLVVGIISASGKGGGVAAPISVLLAAVGVVALGWLVSRYAREVHAAGGVYDYVSRGLGQRVGVATGILYYAGILLLSVGSSSSSEATSTTRSSPSSTRPRCPPGRGRRSSSRSS